MNKITTLAVFALLAIPFAAQANDHAAEHATPAVENAVEAVAPAVEVKEVTLKDGTKVVIEGDVVSVVAEDGTKTAAPDGEHELADGTKVTVKEGKLVPAVAAEPAVVEPAHATE